jgi:hypothetical protein
MLWRTLTIGGKDRRTRNIGITLTWVIISRLPRFTLMLTKQQTCGSGNQPKWCFRFQAPARDRTLTIRLTHTHTQSFYWQSYTKKHKCASRALVVGKWKLILYPKLGLYKDWRSALCRERLSDIQLHSSMKLTSFSQATKCEEEKLPMKMLQSI